MIIFAIILILFLYIFTGLVGSLICAAILDSNPRFFGEVFTAQPETNQIIIVVTFWPILLIYSIGWGIVWYVKHLYITIRDFLKSFIKIEK